MDLSLSASVPDAVSADSDHKFALCGDLAPGLLAGLLDRFGLRLSEVAPGAPIPGSFWGEPEAGIIGCEVLVRPDTPVHSALHEACHLICADAARRAAIHTDAGGGYDEENGVCYLQIVLADHLPGFGRDRALADMDGWGYSFRLGSARAWFEQDAEDARAWLAGHGLLDAAGQPTWRMR
jgi:hypothetical protein